MVDVLNRFLVRVEEYDILEGFPWIEAKLRFPIRNSWMTLYFLQEPELKIYKALRSFCLVFEPHFRSQELDLVLSFDIYSMYKKNPWMSRIIM